jgi:hypothetical protein
MTDEITIQQLSNAVTLTRYQIDAWISRGHFRPGNQPENGKARIFTWADAMALGAMAAFVRLGIQAATVGPLLSPGVHGFEDEQALMVICEGPTRLSSQSDAALFETSTPTTFAKIIRASHLPGLLDDPEITSFAVVNLNTIEQRIQRALATN